MSFEPTEEQRRAYVEAQRNKNSVLIWPLADLAQQATAAALQAEHYNNCPQCACRADWLKLADEKLRKP